MLAPQYKRDIGEQAEYVPTTYNGLWRCTCGALNRIDESSCHSCNLNKIEQIKNLDHNILAANKRAFDMAEEEKARILAEQDRIKRQQAEEKKRAENLETKKQIKKLVIVGICLAIIGVAGFAINSVVKKSNLYESAIESYQNEKPVSLLGVLDKLNELPSDYKDTQRYIDEINSIIRNLNGSYRWEGVTYWGGEPMPTLLTFTIDNNQFGAPGGSYDKAEVLWYIENGTIVSGEVTIPDKSNPEDWHLKNFELTPTETGFDLKARKRDGFRDIFYCKEYTKQ